MQIFIEYQGQSFQADLSKPLDLSIPLRAGEDNVNAYYINPARFEPFKAGSFIGSVEAGGPCNCEDIFFNAHGNGTHTEGVGHIAQERITINECLKTFMFIAELITVTPEALENGDQKISVAQVKELRRHTHTDALVVRTLPNTQDKLVAQYSGSNPPYFEEEALQWVREEGIKHLVFDRPSVDRESDGGALAAHHAFWNYPEAPRMDATITEMAYIADDVQDGLYLLNLQIASFESDASPSKPILYALNEK